ncbi:MAG: alanine--tRNA ligase [Mycoplasmataceae bacterium]|nr:alanine--tRNA ligase [Mycoplasmataceae bacterium]
MRRINYKELRELWRKFFESKQHLYIESKSLIPNNDPSLLWINSGVATLKKYFSGIENPPASRLVNLQKAVRTNDIENVGRTSRHHTFFEMMGNFSIGDYFKDEAIEYAYEFLINWLEIDQDLLYITVYEKDEKAYDKWISLGIKKDHIFKEGKDRNFWDVGNGPCGPCTEIYFDRGKKYDPNNLGIKLLEDDLENDRYVEIWNIVFSEFNNNGKNEYSELKRKNIDTGAGYERFLSILQEVPTNYDTDLFLPLIQELQKYTTYKYDIDAFFHKEEKQLEINRYFKVIVDHIKSAVFMVADGALPSNKDRGYILRRLIRRAISFAEKLNLKDGWMQALINKIIYVMHDAYSYLDNLKNKICNIIINEQKQFEKTLKIGLKLFYEALKNNDISAKTVFDLVQTYGFPKILVDEMCNDNKVKYDEKAYEKLFKTHQEISKGLDKNQIKALLQQNKFLLELNVKSEFDYETNYIKDAKVVYLFDDEFNPIEILSGSGWVVLDKTCLYATGGGQLHDEGYINDFEVDNVIKAPNLQHLHHLDSAYLKLNEIVSVHHNELTRSLLRCNHTAVHLIQAMLKTYISDSIKQAGAFKSKEKFSFDFTYEQKLSNSQIKMIEEEANKVIKEGLLVQVLHTDLMQAQKMHAIMEFNDVYSKQKTLRLVKIGDVSLELCGGTHAHNTYELEILKITNYSTLGSGTWRIEGFSRYLNYFKHLQEDLNNLYEQNEKTISSFLLSNKKEFETNLDEVKNYKNIAPNKLINNLNLSLIQYEQSHLKQQNELEINNLLKQIKETKELIILNNVNPKNIATSLRSSLNELNKITVIINKLQEGYSYFVAANKTYLINNQIDLKKLVNEIDLKINGKSGGKDNYFQGGTNQEFNESIWKQIFYK